MLKENKNIKIIAGLMMCSACLIPFVARHHNIHADVTSPTVTRNEPREHNSTLSHKQKVVLTLQQRINQYQHNNNNIKSKAITQSKTPNFTSLNKSHNNNVLPLSNRVKNNTQQFSNIKSNNKNVIANEQPTKKDKQQINHLHKQLSHQMYKKNNSNLKQVKRNNYNTSQKKQILTRKVSNYIPKYNVRMTRSTQPSQNLDAIQPYHDLSKSVLRYRPYLNKVCRRYHMRNYEVLMLAIMENESHGNGKDIMQASASLGKKPNSLNQQQSIIQAVRYMRGLINHAQQMDKAEQHNKHIKPQNYHHYATDSGLLAQSYNFGDNFLTYVGQHNQGFNINISRKYSRNVIAPLLGNKKHKTYTYNNELAKFYHTPYLYKDGGNYLYGMMVDQYISDGTPMQPILHNLARYNNSHYIYGGKRPKDGFDDSGLVAYGYNKTFHINLPKTTYSQWRRTRYVKGGINDAKPGDLIFFKGTYGKRNHLSHVEFVVNRHLMFGITRSGVGFHYINNPYWMKHFAGVRRVAQYHHINLQTERKLNRQARQYSQFKM